MSILFERGIENLFYDSCQLSSRVGKREDATKRQLLRDLPCLCTIIRVYSIGCELLHVPYHHTVKCTS